MSAIFIYWPLPFSRPLQRNKVKESGEGRSLPVGGSFESELLSFADFSRNSLYPIRTRNNSLHANSPKPVSLITGFLLVIIKNRRVQDPKISLVISIFYYNWSRYKQYIL